ncbi:adenylate/guanylate cyclase domain-containing protein [Phormidium sp. CCY1219]|uniref:adenylate/guanylate cyclase domain-containing protein n=1 Tax=Phormidium sp. CCY1219 TaxID=2886104 RepID=UPI002D1ED3AF|nr:adenylate/guanylate cyclase domain-containing protein [Phormidium sp. CCY1219]MEB3827664.1 adenylate/guanylate cyclase domain-containing protein [Phormidium sp. CCY1219]
MAKWQPLSKPWRSLNITGKFSSAFVGLLLLLTGVAATGWVSLTFVRRETEAAIVTSIKLQRLVFEMNDALDDARRKEREFFETWSKEGFLDAREDYARAHREEVNEVLEISDRLQQLLAGDNVSTALRQSHPAVVSYVEMVEQYASSFKEAVGLVGELGMDETGTIAQLEQNSQLLRDTLELSGEPDVMELYAQIQLLEKEYLLTRENAQRVALNKGVEELRDAVVRSPNFDAERQATALEYLREYDAIADRIVGLDGEIRSQISRFDEQAAEVSMQLLQLATDEVRRAQTRIAKTSQAATGLLVAALLLAVVFASAIAQEFFYALRQLEIEQEKSESLLLNILPKPIAERLKEQPTTIADRFTDVTVLFADIVGFTNLSSRISAEDLVKLLNEIFSDFDRLADLHHLEKIKTIGDAYMVVGGLPEPNTSHAWNVAEMALDMQQAIANFNQVHNENVNIRIGINTGAVVAGVIGQKKFIYDLWGDAVNIASRMESHGIPGYIQISESTYELLRDRYRFEERGTIPVKGKGEMKTYLLIDKNLTEPVKNKKRSPRRQKKFESELR